MMCDLSVFDVHDLDEVDLISDGGLAGILPSQDPAVGQEQARSVPSQEVVGSPPQTFIEEMFDLRPPTQHALRLVVQNRRDERRLEDCIIGVKVDEPVCLARYGKFMPLFVDSSAIAFAVPCHCAFSTCQVSRSCWRARVTHTCAARSGG